MPSQWTETRKRDAAVEPPDVTFHVTLADGGQVLGTRGDGAAAALRLRNTYAGESTIALDFDRVEAATIAYLSEVLRVVSTIKSAAGSCESPTGRYKPFNRHYCHCSAGAYCSARSRR